MNKIKDYLIGGACALAIGAVLFFAVIKASELPDVWFSYKTQDCVQVVNYVEGQNYSCENLPPKYYHVWVK